MADITEELEKFKHAVYGEEVRDAMISAITAINEESKEPEISKYITVNGTYLSIDGLAKPIEMKSAHNIDVDSVGSTNIAGKGGINITAGDAGDEVSGDVRIEACEDGEINLIGDVKIDGYTAATEDYVNGKLQNVATEDYVDGKLQNVATLDASGHVPSSQLPSYVDDVLEFASRSAFPATGETGKIYVDISANKTYRWSGTTYVSIGGDLALGETSSTAYPGDKGKAVTDRMNALEPVAARLLDESGSVSIQFDELRGEKSSSVSSGTTRTIDVSKYIKRSGCWAFLLFTQTWTASFNGYALYLISGIDNPQYDAISPITKGSWSSDVSLNGNTLTITYKNAPAGGYSIIPILF